MCWCWPVRPCSRLHPPLPLEPLPSVWGKTFRPLDLKLLRPAVSQCCSLQIKCHITEFVIQDGCSVHNIPHHFQQCCNIALLFMCSTLNCPKAFSAPSGASNPELIPSHRLWFHDLIFGVLPFCHWNIAMLRLMLQMLKKIKIYLKKKLHIQTGFMVTVEM